MTMVLLANAAAQGGWLPVKSSASPESVSVVSAPSLVTGVSLESRCWTVSTGEQTPTCTVCGAVRNASFDAGGVVVALNADDVAGDSPEEEAANVSAVAARSTPSVSKVARPAIAATL